jgi:ATPase family associated with various cellular activities (AAA)
MSLSRGQEWTLANQRCLMAEVASTRATIERCAARNSSEATNPAEVPIPQSPDSPAAQMDPPPALDRLCAIFGLSSFERTVLLACAGMELDSRFAQTCAAAQADKRACPTFALLLAAFGDAHWDATSPAAPLRHWRLIEMESGPTLTTSPLRIDERILHYLTGTSYVDQRLNGYLQQVSVSGSLPPSQQRVAQRAVALWVASEDDSRVMVELSGASLWTRQTVAATTCSLAGLPAYRVLAAVLPLHYAEIHSLLRLVEREAMLHNAAIVLDCHGLETHDGARTSAVRLFAEGLAAPLIAITPRRLGGYSRQAVFLEVSNPLMEEQRSEWRARLGDSALCLNGSLDVLVSQFNMSGDQIHASSLRAATLGEASSEPNAAQTLDAIWESCRVQARPALDELAQRVETGAGWDGLVLPQPQLDLLRDIAAQMRLRARVYHGWGFAAGSGRGLGITALFSGASGTGKTTAAEILATELKLDLYRIDLSQVVSKYIGETEKSLRRIFDAAEAGGALLFFDEADALFGRRTEVKDSHDRYANIEVSYLLQRMEAYRGLAVLATNMRQALDPAFLRRIRFIVQFPFPDAALREEIWRRAIPPQAPTEAIEVRQLARLCVTGGNIRNIAVGAAFLAMGAGEPIRMSHLLEAARREYLKIEKPLTETEIRGWV